MTIAAATVFPDFFAREKIDAQDLVRLEGPCVVFEHHWRDADGEPCWAYTVGGLLNGVPIGGLQGGATIGGDVMIVHANTRSDADYLAGIGLQETIAALRAEADAYIDAEAAKARLATVSPVRRLELATADAADMSDEFVRDSEAIRKLRGDDITLTTGAEAPAH